jgi:hypothetical protein
MPDWAWLAIALLVPLGLIGGLDALDRRGRSGPVVTVLPDQRSEDDRGPDLDEARERSETLGAAEQGTGAGQGSPMGGSGVAH